MKAHPLIKVTLLYISGIILQKYVALDLNLLVLTAFILIVCSFFLVLNRSVPLIIISLVTTACIILTSAISYQLSFLNLRPYPFKTSRMQDIIISGKISDIELKRINEFRFTLKTDSLRIKDHIVLTNFKTLCRIRDDSTQRLDSFYNKIKSGNYVKLKGTFSKARERRNPWEFDYQKYLVEKGFSAIFLCSIINNVKLDGSNVDQADNLIFNVRKAIDRKITVLHSKTCSSLLRGLLLADRSEISDDVQTDFINTGVVHILAVSGSNVLLIIVIFSFLFGRFQIYTKTFLTVIGLLLFLALTGVTPSVLRAVIMAIIVLIAYLTNRSHNISNAVFLSALIILIINPLQLFDPGFQLSYSAVLSLIYINPKIMEAVKRIAPFRSKIIGYFLVFAAVTLSAQIGTLPFTLFYFGKISFVSILSNLIIIPLIGVLTGSAIFTLVISIVWGWAAKIFANANNILTQIIYSSAHYLSNIKYSFLFIRDFTLYDSVVFYFFILLFFLFVKKFSGFRNKIILLCLILLCFFAIMPLDNRQLLPDGKLSVMAIDVGQGDATLIKFPDNKTLLLDAGQTTQYFDNGEKVILPLLTNLGIESLDYGIISHIDSDHYSGFISLVKKGLVKIIYKPLPDSAYQKDVKFERFLKELKVPVNYFKKNSITFDNARLYIMNDEKWDRLYKLSRNDNSSIVRISYGSTDFLFVGDAGKRTEHLLIKQYREGLSSELLKLGHHGSKGSSSINFLKTVNPRYGLISAGVQNRFHHPSPLVLKELDLLKIQPLRTDLSGAIILISDGVGIELFNWRNKY